MEILRLRCCSAQNDKRAQSLIFGYALRFSLYTLRKYLLFALLDKKGILCYLYVFILRTNGVHQALRRGMVEGAFELIRQSEFQKLSRRRAGPKQNPERGGECVMANKQPYWKLVQKNLNEVLGETMSGWLPVVLFQLIGVAGEGLKTTVANRILAICLVGLRSDKILRSDDWQEDIGAIASAVVPNPIQRRLASKALEELFEEAVTLQDAFDKNESGDKDVTKSNLEKAKALLLGLAP